jgi:hypothetical protein
MHDTIFFDGAGSTLAALLSAAYSGDVDAFQ